MILIFIIGIILGYSISIKSLDYQAAKNQQDQQQELSHESHESVEQDSSMSMSDMMADMTASLEGKQGDAFDQVFIKEMIVHHEGAVAMAELALTQAGRQEIKDLANAIITAQNTEIAQMKEWLKSWYTN